ncbi:MAG: hypothetical protein JO138_18270 [Acidobacteriaceae bacterium]|nr:hypothetical protein [Acidobacteriaceae bacterium]
MIFENAPQQRKPFPAYAFSVFLHALLIVVMATWTVSRPQTTTVAVKHNYSIRFLQLQPLQPYRRRAPEAPSRSSAGQTGSAQLAKLLAPTKEPAPAASGGSESSVATESPAPPQHRQFKLPPTSRVDKVKQTLVQLDLPPSITLKQEIPLPTVVLWTQTELPKLRKPFIAPPVKAIPKVIQRLPSAPMLERPNLETNVADVNMASTILTDTPHLVHPPGVAPPVSTPGPEPAKEIPRIDVADSTQPSDANLVSLPSTPSRTANLLVLPPANQIAPSDATNGGLSHGTGAGGEDNSHGSGTQGNGMSASGSSGAEGNAVGGKLGGRSGATAGGIGGAGSGASGDSAGSGAGAAGAGNGSIGAGNGGNGTAAAGSGGNGSGADGSGGSIGTNLAGFTRITLPKDGKFGVVVTGASASTPYPESEGALSGKIVYTVYLRVGLRKSWILQYCLPKAVDGAKRGTATPLDAPWPFLMMRPDHLNDFDPDYIMVHGMLTSAGQFDQLAMVFPAELDQRDLLLKSLKLWAFRPASRDGEPIAVEVLLIIPRETE